MKILYRFIVLKYEFEIFVHLYVMVFDLNYDFSSFIDLELLVYKGFDQRNRDLRRESFIKYNFPFGYGRFYSHEQDFLGSARVDSGESLQMRVFFIKKFQERGEVVVWV
jgi:hypothetical protein